MRYCYLITFIFVISCSTSISKDVLSPEKMQSVLWDVLRADEVAGYYLSKDSIVNRLQHHSAYYQQILQIHKITKEEVKKSIQYYQNNPILFKVILDSLQQFAERQQKKADSTLWSKPSGLDSKRQTLPKPVENSKVN